jgi:hypothetical protein
MKLTDLLPWLFMNGIVILAGLRIATTRILIIPLGTRVEPLENAPDNVELRLTELRALNYGLFMMFVGLLMAWFSLYILLEKRYDLLEQRLFLFADMIGLIVLVVVLLFALFVEAVTKHYEINAPRKRKHSDNVHPLEQPPPGEDFKLKKNEPSDQKRQS